MTKEVMKQALDAFEAIMMARDIDSATTIAKNARYGLREALKQEQGERVANASTWFALVMNAAAELENASIFLRDEDAKRVAIRGAKYYRDRAKTLYTKPQQRKPLTDEQILHIVSTHIGEISPSYPLDNSDWINFAHAIESAYGIKQ